MGSKQSGTWVWVIFATDKDGVMNRVTKERWAKMRDKIWWIAKQVDLVDEYMPVEREDISMESADYPERIIHFKTTERIMGFLVYVAQTYTVMVLYLKGIYLTLNLWKCGQDIEGWTILKLEQDNAELYDKQPPKFVKCVPWLKYDIAALIELTAKEDPLTFQYALVILRLSTW